MSDFVERLIIDDSGAIEPLKNIAKEIEKANKEYNALTAEVDQETKKMADDVSKGQKNMTKAITETTKAEREQAQAVKNKAKEYKILGVSFNDLKNKLNEYKSNLAGSLSVLKSFGELSMTQKRGVIELTNALGGGRSAFVALAKGVNIFKAALVSTGIGALVVGLGSLVSFLTTSQEGMNLVSRATGAAGIAFDVTKDKVNAFGKSIVTSFQQGTVIQDFINLIKDQLFNRLSALPDFFGAVGLSIKSAFTGNFQELKESAKDAGLALAQFATGIKSEDLVAYGNQLIDAVKAMDAIIVREQQLIKVRRDLGVETAKQNVLLREYRLIAADTTKSFSERTEAAKKAFEIETSQLNKRLKLANEELSLINRKNDLAENTNKDYQKVADKEVEIANIRADSLTLQRKLNNEINGLIKEQRDLFTGIQKSLIELGTQYNILSGKEQFDLIKKEQITQLETYIIKLKDVGTTLAIDVSKELQVAQSLIDGFNSREFVDEIENIGNSLDRYFGKDGGLFNLGTRTITPPKIVISEPDTEPFFAGIDTFEDLLQKTLDEIFGSATSGEKAREFVAGLSEFVTGFGNILNEATTIQLRNIDKVLSSISERRATLEDELNKELELQKEGLANNVGNKQDEVNKLLAEEQRLQQEREKIQMEAERRQLIADTVQQTQSLITSSINIIKGFSNIPIIGLPLGIAAVGTLLAFFAKTKINAFKATRLYTGADKISDHFGFGQRHGATDLPGRGAGYRLVDERTGNPTNVIISGREMLLPEKVSLQNEDFFNKLRLGMYDGLNLSAIMDFYKNFKLTPSQIKVSQPNITVNNKNVVRQFIPIGNGKFSLVTIRPEMKDGTIIEVN